MQRTTLNLPTTLHHRLMFEAKNERKTFADLVRDLLDQALQNKETIRIQQSYQALDKIKSMAQGIPEASSHIDELLYGEKGVWKGGDESV